MKEGGFMEAAGAISMWGTMPSPNWGSMLRGRQSTVVGRLSAVNGFASQKTLPPHPGHRPAHGLPLAPAPATRSARAGHRLPPSQASTLGMKYRSRRPRNSSLSTSPATILVAEVS